MTVLDRTRLTGLSQNYDLKKLSKEGFFFIFIINAIEKMR